MGGWGSGQTATEGIWLQTGDKIYLGGTGTNPETESTGHMVAGNSGLLINCTDSVSISNELYVGDSLGFGSASSGYGAMWLDRNGIYFNGRYGTYHIYAENGNADLNQVDVKSLYINGVSITEYIRQKVQELIVNNLPSTVVTSITATNWDSFIRHNGGSHDYWGIGLTGIQAKTEDIPSRIDYPTED
jgi:hypothetical protein